MTASAPPDPTQALGALQDYMAGRIPQHIALMRLIMATSAPAELERLLNKASVEAGTGCAAGRLDALKALAVRNPDAWATIRVVASAVSHDLAPGRTGEAAVRQFARAFDRAAAISPEASVALYSLGDGEGLAAATAEIAVWLDGCGLLGPARDLLDIGCGIGRLEAALHGRVRSIVGTDITPRMIRAARSRCAAFENVSFRLASGLDLAGFEARGFDCIVAADVFPYLVLAGNEIAGRHVHDAARLLKPGGELVILNYSYRGDPERDRTELLGHAQAAGMSVVECGTSPFSLWDAKAYRLASAG